jgi:hypothetical protein
MQIHVAGMHEDVVSHARPGLLALLGAVAFVRYCARPSFALERLHAQGGDPRAKGRDVGGTRAFDVF